MSKCPAGIVLAESGFRRLVVKGRKKSVGLVQPSKKRDGSRRSPGEWCLGRWKERTGGHSRERTESISAVLAAVTGCLTSAGPGKEWGEGLQKAWRGASHISSLHTDCAPGPVLVAGNPTHRQRSHWTSLVTSEATFKAWNLMDTVSQSC